MSDANQRLSESAINYTCLAVDGRESCTNTPPRPPTRSVSPTPHHLDVVHTSIVFIHITDPVHLSLVTFEIGLNCICCQHQKKILRAKTSISTSLAPRELFYHTLHARQIRSWKDRVVSKQVILDERQWVVSIWHIWRVRRSTTAEKPYQPRGIFFIRSLHPTL